MERYLSAGLQSIAVGATATELPTGDSSIRFLVISSHPTSNLTISNLFAVTANNGLVIPKSTHALEMDWERYGDFIRSPLFIVADVACTIGVLVVRDCDSAANDAKEVPGGWNTVKGFKAGR
jgi:hypothetical protein